MQDLEIAKKQLYEKQLKLVIVKDRQVLFQTDSHRISGFIHAIDNLGVKLSGASVADCVGGKALALLCVYAGIHEVYAEVLSKKAKAVFEANEVTAEWKQIVDNVLNSEKTDVCPFEKVAADITDPRVSYAVFKAMLTKMKICG